jgi:TrmH family RNA methyltransferase
MCAATSPSEEILRSRRNPLVGRLRALHEPRGRREQGLLLLEGTHLLAEAVALRLTPHVVLATPEWLDRHPELAARLPEGTPLRLATAEVLAAAATTRHPDGVLLVIPLPGPCRPAGKAEFVLALDHLQDPGNLGTLLRTALAAGVESAWLGEGADPFQPKVLRASSGAVLRLPVERMAAAAFRERLERARREGLQLLAAVVPAPAGEAGDTAATAVPYWEVDWTRPTVLLLGNEGGGVAAGLTALADRRVTIPHSPLVESLNVAVAAAPLLLERRRQSLTRPLAP